MKLPQILQHFPHAALIISSDSMRANFFLVGGDELEGLDGVAMPRELRQDSEGSFTSSDGSRVAGPDADIDDAPRLKQFARRIAERTERLVRDHGIAHVHLVMPAEIEHVVSSSFATDVESLVGFRRHLDLMKEDPLTVVRRVLEG
ncbi:hypothetical protein HY479_02725 [Candidatus Uhrbacteria bacterium]|nr:hypothetical protein [Candidatus Uhrbacteria bacterium]